MYHITLLFSPLPSRKASVGGGDGPDENEADQGHAGKLPLEHVQIAQPPQSLDHLSVM